MDHGTGAMDRDYRFFVTTKEPRQLRGNERGLIRRLVMRNYFETQLSGPKSNSSENTSMSTVQARTNLKSRFRLPKPSKETSDQKANDKHKDSSRRQIREEVDDKDVRPKAARRVSGLSDGFQQEEKSRKSCRKGSPVGNDSSERGEKVQVKTLLKVNPNAHRFDPFDVLPVPGTPQLDTLVKLYKSSSRANSLAINARSTWWSFISNDSGLLHATLATWALYGMIFRGMSELHVDKLRHKNEAIKEINSKIGDPGGRISDELVGTVSTLATFENLLGAYDAAQLHIAALKRMINVRGGLFALRHNDGLVRGISWVDFHTAAAFRTPPSFPRRNLDPNTPLLPDGLLEEAAYTSPTSLLQLSVGAVDCFNIFYRLHRLALASTSRWTQKVNKVTFSDLLYEAEYIILLAPDYSRDFLTFDQERDVRDEDYEQREKFADGACVTEALLAAVQIFIYAGLRDMPPKAKLFKILLERLRVALDRPGVSILEIWKKEKNLNILPWILVVGASIAATRDERGWWIESLSRVIEELGISSRSRLEEALVRVAWTDVFFDDVLGGVWNEISAHSQAVEANKDHVEFTRSGEQQGGESIATGAVDPGVVGVEARETPGVPLQFEEGRWKLNGWYV